MLLCRDEPAIRWQKFDLIDYASALIVASLVNERLAFRFPLNSTHVVSLSRIKNETGEILGRTSFNFFLQQFELFS